MIAFRSDRIPRMTAPDGTLGPSAQAVAAAARFFKDLRPCPMIGGSMPDADLELVRRAQAGDPEAVREIGERMLKVPRMLGCIVRQKGIRLHEADLHDLSHEIITRSWRKIGEFRGDAPLEGWLWRFCAFELMNHLRRRDRGPRLFTDVGEEGIPEPAAESQAPAEPEPLARWLKHLSAREAQVLELKMVDGLSFPEVGETLGVATSTAKTCYYRALEKLTRLREEEGTP